MNSTRLRLGIFCGAIALFMCATSGFAFEIQLPQPPIIHLPEPLPSAEPPGVLIASPTNGTIVTNPAVLVAGTASIDATNIYAWVENSLGTNSATLFEVISFGKPTLWNYQADLVPGYNTVGVTAVGGNGLSADASARIYFKQRTPLTLIINGHGHVTPNLNGKILESSVNYQVSAKPSAGYAFAGWTGGVVTNASTLNFVMASNLVLQANFVPTPFAPAVGVYQGEITPLISSSAELGGSFKAKVTKTGKFTARIRFGKKRYVFEGIFSSDGSYTGSIRRKGLPPIDVQLLLDIDGQVVNGSFTDLSVSQDPTGAMSAQIVSK